MTFKLCSQNIKECMTNGSAKAITNCNRKFRFQYIFTLLKWMFSCGCGRAFVNFTCACDIWLRSNDIAMRFRRRVCIEFSLLRCAMTQVFVCVVRSMYMFYSYPEWNSSLYCILLCIQRIVLFAATSLTDAYRERNRVLTTRHEVPRRRVFVDKVVNLLTYESNRNNGSIFHLKTSLFFNVSFMVCWTFFNTVHNFQLVSNRNKYT